MGGLPLARGLPPLPLPDRVDSITEEVRLRALFCFLGDTFSFPSLSTQAFSGGAPEREALHGQRLPRALSREREGGVARQVAPRFLLPDGGRGDKRSVRRPLS